MRCMHAVYACGACVQRACLVLVQVHVSDFKRLALDASCLIHRGGRASAADYLHSRPSSKWLGYPLRIVDAILNAGATPVVVFDGAPLPMKARTDAVRAAQRQAHRRTAAALLQEGKAAAAENDMAAAFEVTAEMRHMFITALKARRVEFVVAPYEADSQLVFLVESGQCDAAVTEDSDLLAYRCPRTLYKLQESGYARLIKFADLSLAEEGGRRLFDGSWHDEWSSWEGSLFTDMCILAGCDFLEMPAVGIKTAHRQLRQHRSIEGVLKVMLRAGTLDSARAEAYLAHFYRVQLVFRHQRVWDAAAQKVRMLCRPDGPLADDNSCDTDYVGPPLPPAAGRLVSCAALDPRTLLPTALFVEERQPMVLPAARHLQPQSLPQQSQRQTQPPPHNDIGDGDTLSRENIDRVHVRSEGPPSPYRKRHRQTV
jgi:exonuclease-1